MDADDVETELKELQARQKEQQMKEQQLRDAAGLLTQLSTVNDLREQRDEGDCFDLRVQPSGRLFLNGLPEPADFAAGLPADEQVAPPEDLLIDEICNVLQEVAGCSSIPAVTLRHDRGSGKFLGCATVVCGSSAEASHMVDILMAGTGWCIPPLSKPVKMYHMEDQEPVVLLRGSESDMMLQSLLGQFADIADISETESNRPTPTQRPLRGAPPSPHSSPLSRSGSIRSPASKRREAGEALVVKLKTMEDAYTVMACCHRRPVPTRDDYTIEMDTPVDEDRQIVEELRFLISTLGANPDMIGLINVQPSLLNRSPTALSVRVTWDGDPDVMRNLVCTEGGDTTVTSVSMPALLNLRLRRRPRRLRAADRERLVNLEDALKMEKQRSSALYRELHAACLPRWEAKEKAVALARGELAAMRVATGWDERKLFTTHTQDDRENRLRVLLRELASLQGEQKMLRTEDDKASQRLEEVAVQLHRRDSVLREHARLVDELRSTREEDEDRTRELRSLKRILVHKGRRTDMLIAHTDAAKIKILEGDKRVAQQALRRAQQRLRAREDTIAAQHLRTQRLEEQLERLVSVLQKAREQRPDPDAAVDGDSGDGCVSAAEYERLQKSVVRAMRQQELKRLVRQEKDGQIEWLERRCEAAARHVGSVKRVHGVQQTAMQQEQSYIAKHLLSGLQGDGVEERGHWVRLRERGVEGDDEADACYYFYNKKTGKHQWTAVGTPFDSAEPGAEGTA